MGSQNRRPDFRSTPGWVAPCCRRRPGWVAPCCPQTFITQLTPLQRQIAAWFGIPPRQYGR